MSISSATLTPPAETPLEFSDEGLEGETSSPNGAGADGTGQASPYGAGLTGQAEPEEIQ